jgi:hypothetical protein
MVIFAHLPELIFLMTIMTLEKKSFGATFRTDNWWLEPMLVMLGFLAFIAYSTWAAWQGSYYWWSGAVSADGFGGYLSPFYSPPLFIKEVPGSAPLSHAWFGAWPAWLNLGPLPASPAWLILIFPLSFRFTCYYYRKAYYRAFAGTPPACAVGAIPQKPYKGEAGLMVFQNIHRYAMYFAVIIIFLLTYDAIMAFFNNGRFGVGVGSIVLLINPILLGAYTFGCHSFRHLIGGRHDCFSCHKTSHGAWKKVSVLNGKHMMFAWYSLVWVGFSDFYVRMVSMGLWTDYNTWGV